MNPSTSDYIAMLTRLDKNKVRDQPTSADVRTSQRESTLHDQIIEYCNSQWPKFKYIHARMDKRSTIQVGAPDFCPIFLPGGKIIIFECKRQGEKCTPEQLAWHKELEMLGHTVHVIYTFSQFLDALDSVLPPQGVSRHPPGHESSPEAKLEGNT